MIVLYCFYIVVFVVKIDRFIQKRLVLQVKELSITGSKIHQEFAQIVTKSISNDGNLKLSNCKIAKSTLEEFCAALKDKLVIKIKLIL